ncbi:MAG: hypothetical protein A2Y41_04660 [Spirochaetes bacterium GWB1_36_13]|nr:MAG: hypothetical protein A2Y41_04660 [Spirochaetes bacterium GWB1_36_13]
MACVKCIENQENIEWEEQEEKPFWIDSLESLLEGYSYSGVKKCLDCSSFWFFSSEDIYLDPRDRGGPPNYVIIRGKKLSQEEIDFIIYPKVKHLPKLPEHLLKYWFIDYYIHQLEIKEPDGLKDFASNLSDTIFPVLKNALFQWYLAHYKDEIEKSYLRENDPSFILFETKEYFHFSKAVFLDSERLAFVYEDDESNSKLAVFSIVKKMMIFEIVLQKPLFFYSQLIEPIMVIEKYLIILHRKKEDDLNQSVSIPEAFSVYDFDGNLILLKELEWEAEEIPWASLIEGTTQNRFFHNFHFSLKNGFLFYAQKHHLLGFDLEKRILVYNFDIQESFFTGEVFFKENSLLCYLRNGMVEYDFNANQIDKGYCIVEEKPVFMFPNFFTFFQNGQAVNPKTGTRIQYPEIIAPCIGGRESVLVPFEKEIRVIDEKGNNLAKHYFKILGSFDEEPQRLDQKSFFDEDYFAVIGQTKIMTLTDKGEKIGEFRYEGYPVAFKKLGNQRILFVESVHTRKKDIGEWQCRIFDSSLSPVFEKTILFQDQITAHPDGIWAVLDSENGFKIKLFFP